VYELGGLQLTTLTIVDDGGSAQGSWTGDTLTIGSGDIIQISAANAEGHTMSITEIDVCVDGEMMKMKVLASEPY
jgi:hypothetical protein